MKKITTLFVAAVSIFAATQLMSCKKKEKDASIVGTWQSQTLSVKTTTAGIVLNDTSKVFTDIKITFNADKTYASVDLVDAKNNDNGTYSINGSKIYSTNSKGNKDSSDFTVTSTQLTLGSSQTDTSGGVTSTSEFKITLVRK